MVFDGKALTLLGKNANLYAQIEAPGTIDQLVDVLRNKYHRPVPAADLLMADPYEELMPHVTDAKDLGSGMIHGVECDHLAFRCTTARPRRPLGVRPGFYLPLTHRGDALGPRSGAQYRPIEYEDPLPPFSGNSDGRLVTRRCQSSPSPNR